MAWPCGFSSFDSASTVAFSASASDLLIDMRTGYPWDCSSDRALDGYFTRADVQAALHLKGPGSGFKCGAAHESDLTPSPRRHTRFAQVQAERPRVATPLAAFGPTHAGIDL